MDFGDWVLKTRKERELDLRTLSEKTNVDMGTISRIEHSHTNSTVFTAFRLVEGLGVSLPVFINELTGNSPTSIRDEKSEKANTVLTLKDIEILVEEFDENGDSVREYLKDTMNGILNFIPDRISVKFGENNRLIPLSVDDIDRFLFRSPLYRFELRYPIGIGARRIQHLYEQRAALVPNDIQHYLRGKRLEGLTRIASNVSNRLLGTGALDRIKLNELLSLDKELEEGGRLLGIYWEACRFDERFTPSIHHSIHYEQPTLFGQQDVEELETAHGRKPWEHKLALLYVLIYRWYVYLNRHGELPPFGKYDDSIKHKW